MSIVYYNKLTIIYPKCIIYVTVKLKELRESHFITQAELAELIGVARVTINRLEGGQKKARFSTIRKLAKALSVEPKEIDLS
jgi:DNA-binding XRE family transcriptional regulator